MLILIKLFNIYTFLHLYNLTVNYLVIIFKRLYYFLFQPAVEIPIYLI